MYTAEVKKFSHDDYTNYYIKSQQTICFLRV